MDKSDRQLMSLMRAPTGEALAAALRQAAVGEGFRSVVLIDMARSGQAIDRIADTEAWRGRLVLDLVGGVAGPELTRRLADSPAILLTAAGLADAPALVDAMRSADLLDSLLVPVLADGRLASLVVYGGATGPVPPRAMRALTGLGLAALACFQARPLTGTSDARVYLTEREREVLRLAAAGLTSREIAAALGMAMRTTNQHIDNAGYKLATRNRAHTVAEATRLGLLGDAAPAARN